MEPRHLIRAAIIVSVIGHLALAVGVYFADARPFDPSVTENIAVDVVTPQQVAAIEKAAEVPPPASEPPKPQPPKPEFRLPDLDKPTLDDKKAQPEAQKQPPPQTPPQAAQQAAPPTAAAVPSPAAPPASVQPASQPPTPPPAQQQAALQPAPEAPPPPVAEPDITVKYGVQLGLPDGNGGSLATAAADIDALDINAFRRHLRSCSALPGEVARTDKVRIVLRAFFAPDGRLKSAPTLIEASASMKGPLLMQAAIKALQACQPYGMLPADKYPEWQVLDLVFTPQDFAG
ncbi:hypothetical protein [Tardiphaga sp.]|uniref:hypothetical protein n=1 Tax=Tardiphaga sp. TaxID=1926292 RepID=UPI0026107C3F|nr:hypothetical protein [Tardiphaga sp.]MDB5618357.1 hypothetical protein [Tardiphaga sp.]